MLSMAHSDLFIFDNFISITLNQNFLVFDKNRLSEGHPRFISIFPLCIQ